VRAERGDLSESMCFMCFPTSGKLGKHGFFGRSRLTQLSRELQ
jgi:hypothetical protein